MSADAGSPLDVEVVVVGAGFAGLRAAIALRDAGIEFIVLEKGAEVRSRVFDDGTDVWTLTGADGATTGCRAVIDATGSLHVPDIRGVSVFGGAVLHFACLGVAVHGMPNHFLVNGPDSGVGDQSVDFVIEAQTRYIASVLRAMRDRRSTRVEVKSHVQQHFTRELQRRSAGISWTSGGRRRTRKPALADFEFTRAEDRGHQDQYHGPALLVVDDGTELPVRVHLIAVYQPIDNQVHWSGRIDPDAMVTQLHLCANQQVRLRIPGNAPVDARLTDSDPWGGTRIAGYGSTPYPLETDAAVPGVSGTPTG